jgi:hypothetical protein
MAVPVSFSMINAFLMQGFLENYLETGVYRSVYTRVLSVVLCGKDSAWQVASAARMSHTIKTWYSQQRSSFGLQFRGYRNRKAVAYKWHKLS